MSLEYFEKTVPKPPEEYVRVDSEKLRKFVALVFQSLGVSERDSEIVADVLITANLFGIDSHGVQRLRLYVDRIRRGLIKPKFQIRIVRNGTVHALVDGDNGLGQPIAYKSMEIAIDKALRYGVGVVGVRNSNHFGIAGYYALIAVKRNMIGMVMTNARPLMSYTHTIGKNLGTNPIAIGVPTKNPPPYLYDGATSVVPIGKVEVLAKEGKKMPIGWGIDSKGELTDNPNIVLKEGAVLPLGGLGEILGGHKGSGLALTIDILCGILTGANWGPYVGPKDKPANVGHFMVAINIEEFLPLQEFLERMEKLRTYIKSLPKHPKAKRIWIPGEKSWLTMQTRLKKGIPIHKAILNDIEKIARELNLKFELEDLRKRT